MSDTIQCPKKNVFILQQEIDIEAYLNNRISYPGEHVLISTSPDVCWDLEKRALSYKSIEEYSDFEELFILGTENYQRLEKLCTEIDPYLRQKYPILLQSDFRPLKDNFFGVKTVFDTFVFRISMIAAVIRKEKPDILIIFSSDSTEKRTWEPNALAFRNSDNVFEMLLSLDGWNCPVSKISVPNTSAVVPTEKTHHTFSYQLRNSSILTQFPFLFIPLFSLKNFGLLKTLAIILYQFRNSLQKGRTIFLLRQEPSWSSILFLLYQHGYQVVYLSHQKNTEQPDFTIETEDRKFLMDAIKPYALYYGIDFSGLLLKFLVQSVEEYLTILPPLLGETEKRIAKYHPVIFAGSEKASNVEHIFSHVAHKYRIPVISWQHGDGPFFPPMQVYVELMNSDIHMCYGPGHQKMLTEAQKTPPFCREESVGSYTLEKIFQNSPSAANSKKILYVTAGYYYNNIYQNVHPPNDNQAWRHQKQILTTLGNSNHPVYFKIWPGPFRPVFFREFISQNKYSNITTIWNQKSFSDLLAECDIVVCDLASTPVIEAIAAHKTVFVLTWNEKYLRPESLDLLKKRVYTSSTIDEFTKMIQDYLKGRPLHQKPDINNTEYLEQFGVHKLDGNVGDRVLSLLDAVITEKNQ